MVMLLLRRSLSRKVYSFQPQITWQLERFISNNSNSSTGPHPDEGPIVGAYTPVTKRLWKQRYEWTDKTIQEAGPQTTLLSKSPSCTEVCYPFSSDIVLREHYRNPWNWVRIGRILEDMDSLAGFVAYTHCDDNDPTTRPPLLVTATVEAIRIKGAALSLEHDMKLQGRVIWTGSSSLDIHMELKQHGTQRMAALFTFVARDAIGGEPHKINPVVAESDHDKEIFAERQHVSEERKAHRALAKAGGITDPPEVQQYIADLMNAARAKRDLPALAAPYSLLSEQTSLSNTFTTQPQQRNLHGRVFGGFLMRRAFELAHSTAYLFAGCRPSTELVDEIQFKRPVNIGDLLKFTSWVLHTQQDPKDPSKGRIHVQVQANVTQPERMQSHLTNTFNFIFTYDLKRKVGPAIGGNGEAFELPFQVLPSKEEHAHEAAKYYAHRGEERGGKGGKNGNGHHSSKLGLHSHT